MNICKKSRIQILNFLYTNFLYHSWTVWVGGDIAASVVLLNLIKYWWKISRCACASASDSAAGAAGEVRVGTASSPDISVERATAVWYWCKTGAIRTVSETLFM